MAKAKKKKYTGIFRDGGAGKHAIWRFRDRRKKLMQKEDKLMVITGVPYRYQSIQCHLIAGSKLKRKRRDPFY